MAISLKIEDARKIKQTLEEVSFENLNFELEKDIEKSIEILRVKINFFLKECLEKLDKSKEQVYKYSIKKY